MSALALIGWGLWVSFLIGFLVGNMRRESSVFPKNARDLMAGLQVGKGQKAEFLQSNRVAEIMKGNPNASIDDVLTS